MADAIDLGIDGLVDCKEIGSGGFAVVYAAWDESFGRTVAVKILSRLDAAGERRFERERLTMGRMDGHPNVITPHSSGYSRRGLPYLVMEYMPKGSLAALLEGDGPLPWNDAAALILPIADALGYGHSHGVLHHDIKPENILVGTNGIPKLGDFGIASIREATTTQSVAFTLVHAPPETFLGGMDRRDERSDLYSLASTLYTIVNGRPPFDAGDRNDNYHAYVARIADHPVRPIDVNDDANSFLAAAMAKSPDERPPTAAHFIEGLRDTLDVVPEEIQLPTVLPETFDGDEWWEQ